MLIRAHKKCYFLCEKETSYEKENSIILANSCLRIYVR